MKKLLINNLGLKLLSIVTAFMLWLIVLDQVDPVTYETYSPIQVVMLSLVSTVESAGTSSHSIAPWVLGRRPCFSQLRR